MLGKSLRNYLNNSTHKVSAPSRNDLDLRDKADVQEYFEKRHFDLVIHTAARVGGIAENISNPYEMISQNIQIDSNIFDAALKSKVENFVYFGSSCAYPKDHQGLLSEEMILSGHLEPTNEGYALAKIAGIKTVQSVERQFSLNWKSLILSNLFGPGDKFDLSRSHLIASIVRKVQEAKDQSSDSVEMWGNGTARREFTYVDDVSKFLIENLDNLKNFPPYMNLGLGVDYSVREFYEFVVEIMSPGMEIRENPEKPSGMAKKLMDSSIASGFGWVPGTSIHAGLEKTIQWFLENRSANA